MLACVRFSNSPSWQFEHMWTVPHPKFHIEAGRIERNLDVNDVLVGLGNGVYLSLPRNTCVASIMRRASLPM